GRGAQDESERTGFPVIRSFQDEDPALVSSIVEAIMKAAALHADQEAYAEMSNRARHCALEHGWQSVGDKHLAAFERILGTESTVISGSKSPAANDWQSVAMEAGQIIETRVSGGDVPALSRNGDELTYRFAASAVTAFAWNGSSFEEHHMRLAADGSSFVARGVNSSDVFLLVTLSNGDQFWDGLVPLDAPAQRALEETV
ncbi:MAG: hypothetical protein AAFY42_09815, partial [Pseudomonadota bacterium]